MSKVVYEGWMVRHGRKKIGRSFIHMRFFVLETRLLAYYKRKPQDNVVPIKTLLIDGNCRVEDRGLKTHLGHRVYVLSIYNKKDKHYRITMAAFNVTEAHTWKEKIESVIDQHQGSQAGSGGKFVSFEYTETENGRKSSSSDHESQFSAPEDEDNSNHGRLLRRTTIGNGPPDSILDWTVEVDSDLNQNSNNQAFSRKQWRLLQCQNGLRIFEELLEVDFLPKSYSRAMKAVGVVEASCEEIFELVMSMDTTRFEWDCSFQYGNLVEDVDGHTAILHHKLLLDWFPMFVWPRDLCYVRYWRRNDDGSYVVLIRSREHENCPKEPGFVRAHIESGGFNISPLKPRNGRPRTQVQHLMQIDLKGWGVGYIPSFQQHCLLQMLNSVAGLREWFSQTDKRTAPPRIPVMVNMASTSVSLNKNQNLSQSSVHIRNSSLDQTQISNKNGPMNDEYSDDEDDLQVFEEQEEFADSFQCEEQKTEVEPSDQIDFSCFSGNLQRNDNENARNCWRISNGNNFRVRSINFFYDKSKVSAGKHVLDIVAVDWFKDTKRMDHVARRSGCAAQIASEKGYFTIVINFQVPGSTHYSMVFYFVTKKLVPGSLLQRFVDGDDDFRNSRLKLIPSVPKGSWIVRQSVGSTPCLLGKAIDSNYIRGPTYLEIDVDIGSSTVANGVLGLVTGVITTLVVDMAFLVQANTNEELPERLIGAVRMSHIELSSAIVPKLEPEPSSTHSNT
ncbi:protein ENHANCED DISEASE RESISTANCE 2-like [Impatiens glandulifera]|uniref:protein ENHANCED DISEASE RESISTANCE 2-like n=1 Tax=Impatiens glandulifera TaxID=253017 RepID=UPI001FB12AA0|nr:protein ENHANCED DISEASE RESISTANCE 2-like [Impatiens glandulifera]XP_047319904.1 protein ENHANCED DISEASE RESISTANCE 2-like [Impatiens glandulifera]XP_047319905.1 protein ENHANCED DISEASE RESISTANCE 2-like [Impatiens glandulifera]